MKVLSLVTTCIMAFSIQAVAADFQSVWKSALENNASLKAVEYNYQAEKEKAVIGKSALMPNVSAGYTYTVNDSRLKYVNSANDRRYTEDFYESNAVIKLTQPLLRLATFRAYQESKLYPKSAKLQVEKGKEELFIQVLQGYLDILFNKKSLEVTLSKKASIHEQLKDIDKRYRLGDATITDLSEAQARYDIVVAEEIQSINRLDASKTFLSILIDKDIEDADLLDFSLINAFDVKNVKKWIENAELNNKDIKLMKISLEIANKQLSRMTARRVPTVDLTASYTDAYSDGDTTGVGEDSEIARVGISVNLPIYEGGSISANVREKTARKLKTLQELVQVKRDVNSGITSTYLNLKSNLSRLKALGKALDSALVALKSNEKGFDLGNRTSVDLLDAKEQYYNVQRELYLTEIRTFLNYYELLTLAGTLEPADISLIK